MLVTVSDKKIGHDAGNGIVDYYTADVLSAQDFYPFGMKMPGRKYNAINYRYGFNGKEEDDEVKGDGNELDYGMRIYDTRIGRFLSVDPIAKNYPQISNYTFAQNSPVYKLDIAGEWDITVHAYSDRSKYGYGIAIVTDRKGNEIFRFKVRLEGVGGRDRMKEDSDTPLGIYDIPDGADKWTSGKSRRAYGPNSRLVLNGESGEIKESGRSLIRIHGGRQETPMYNKKGEIIGWKPISNAELKKTHGCMRASEADMIDFKAKADQLEASDKDEFGGKLTIVADLQLDKNGEAIIPQAMKPKIPSTQQKSNGPSESKNNSEIEHKHSIIDKIKNWFKSWNKDYTPIYIDQKTTQERGG